MPIRSSALRWRPVYAVLQQGVYDFLNAIPMDELADLFIVSHVELVEGEGGVKGLVEGLGVSAAHAAGNKCLRCWKYDTSVGEDGLCPRCAKVLKL